MSCVDPMDTVAPTKTTTAAFAAPVAMPVVQRSKFYQPHPFWIVPLIFLSNSNSVGPIAIFQHLAKDNFGDASTFWFNVPLAVQNFLAFLVVPIYGSLSDRFGRKPLLVLSVALCVVPSIALYVFRLDADPEAYKTFLYLLATFGISGGTMAQLGLSMAYIADCVEPSKRAATIGLCLALGQSLSWLTAPMVWAWVHEQGGMVVFEACLVCSGLLLVLLAVLVPESNPRMRRSVRAPLQLSDVNPFKGFRLLIGGPTLPSTVPTVRLIFAIMFSFFAMKMGFIISLGLFAALQYDFTEAESSLMQVIFGLFQGIGQLSVGLIVRWLPKRGAVALGVSSGLLACLLPAIPGAPGTVLYLSEAALGFSVVAYTVCCATAMEVVPAEYAGEAATLMNNAMAITGVFGPLSFSLLTQAFLKTAYPGGAMLIFSVVVAFGLALCFRLPSDAALQGAKRLLPNEF